jgi:hypothetical protein
MTKVPTESNNALIATFEAFKKQIYSPKSVLYPSCATDISPAKVFDNVTFVDINKQYIDSLVSEGFNALNQDIRKYEPKEIHDLLLLLNPVIPSEWATKHIPKGAYIIANNYHRNAKQLHEKPNEFKLLSLVDITPRTDVATLSSDFTGIFVPTQSVDEIKRFRPEYMYFLNLCTSQMVKQGMSVEAAYAKFREESREPWPFRRSADYYIFKKEAD